MEGHGFDSFAYQMQSQRNKQKIGNINLIEASKETPKRQWRRKET